MATYNAVVSLRVRDENGGERAITLHEEITVTTADDLDTAVNLLVAAVDQPLQGRIVNCDVTLNIDVSGSVKASPQAGSYVRSGATISMRDSSGNSNPIYFPTMAPTKFIGEVLDDTDPGVDALITALDTPVVSGSASLTAQDEDHRKFTGGYRKGFRTTRK
mgnify:CR=1 FL=1